MQYYGTRLSENISRREPEGYLLCLNVPVARTGMQEYLPEELGLPFRPGRCLPERSFVSVYRPEEEVFSPETIASFEGMPVTNDHPPDGVDTANIRRFQAGHVHNVRRGAGEESDLLLADLVITDPDLIGAVLAGKREISCGYTYELAEENGQYLQRKIRGNHIAVVDAGRAGSRVSIKDHLTGKERSTTMKKSLTRMLARMAKDGDAETVAEFIEEMIGGAPDADAAGTAGPEAENAAEPETVVVEVPENREITIDEDAFSGLLERLDQLIALLASGLASAGSASDDDPANGAGEISEIVEEAVEAVLSEEAFLNAESAGEISADPAGLSAEEIAEAVEAAVEPVLSETIGETEEEEDCGDPEPASAKDALRAALQTFRPVLERMTPRERLRASRDIAARMKTRGTRRTGDRKVVASLAYGQKKEKDLSDLGRRIMASRNANYHKAG